MGRSRKFGPGRTGVTREARVFSSQNAARNYPTASTLGVFLSLSFFFNSIIARIAIAIGSIVFNRSVPVNAASNEW
jgi:hypothetical protein